MAFEWWMLTAGANAVMIVIYALIAIIMVRGIHEGRQWRSNPIAVATAAVFASCTVGHGLHLAHVLPPLSIADPAEFAAAKAMFADPRLIAWDIFTATTAIAFWALRSRLAVVYNGAALCEDLRERERQAALLHDEVMIGIEKARRQLDAGQRDAGIATLGATLEASKGVITTLLGTTNTATALGPGGLRREHASE